MMVNEGREPVVPTTNASTNNHNRNLESFSAPQTTKSPEQVFLKALSQDAANRRARSYSAPG